jgi:hypothetical protein
MNPPLYPATIVSMHRPRGDVSSGNVLSQAVLVSLLIYPQPFLPFLFSLYPSSVVA